MDSSRVPKTVVVVDDEKNIRWSMQMALENEGYKVLTYSESFSALEALKTETVDLAIIDVRLGEISGLDLFNKMIEERLSIPTIFVSGHASLSEAALAVKNGAFDFLEKPFTSEKLLISVNRCLEYSDLKRKALKYASFAHTDLLGESKIIQNLRASVQRIASTQSNVLINGESGTGKELVAQMLHDGISRRNRPMIRVNCSSIPENLIESELFGYERGAFTGAANSKKGLFEEAHLGTLFLDEIGDMALVAQAKVLRAIQNSEIQRLGSTKATLVDVRLICATHKDLKTEVQEGRFREDLYYRINVVPIETPTLREHSDDIPLLCETFSRRYSEKNGLKFKEIDYEVIEQLKSYSWPGNIRELQNLIERLLILSDDKVRLQDLPEEIFENLGGANTGSTLSLKSFRDKAEREHIISVLRQQKGNISRAAEVLGIERTYLHRRIGQFNIEKKDYFI